MSFEWYIAKRLFKSGGKSFSSFIIFVSTTAVALSVAVMILAFSLVNGFQNEISTKVFGFFGHIQVTKYGLGRSFEKENYINDDEPIYVNAMQIENVRHIQTFAIKPGILKTDELIEGIVLKGVGKDFDWKFIQKNLKTGSVFSSGDSIASDKMVISEITASRLNVKAGDKLGVYFMEQPPRVRNIEISGIYNTGMLEFDEKYALIDLRHIQYLNGWKNNEVAGFEIFVTDMHKLDETLKNVDDLLSPLLLAKTIREVYPNIFDWLSLQDLNKYIILILMIAVAAINMITCLLIIILERANMIGILKSLGANNSSIKSIFLFNGLFITGIGLLIGNVLGIGLAWAQYEFRFITLDEKSYLVSYAPIDFSLMNILLIDAGTIIICFMILLLPSLLISRLAPIKILRFE